MEMGCKLDGVPSDDRNAGYIDEDESEIEYSDFEEGDWDFDRLVVLGYLFNAHPNVYCVPYFPV